MIIQEEEEIVLMNDKESEISEIKANDDNVRMI